VTAFSITLGLSGTSLAWRLDGIGLEWSAVVAEVLAWASLTVFAALMALYAAKAVRHPQAVKREWANPITMAFIPTGSISLLLLAATLLPVYRPLATVLWWSGAVFQAMLTLGIVRAWIAQAGINTSHIHPAWFIPVVGNLAAPLAGVEIAGAEVAWLYFGVGILYYLALLPLVLHRLIAVEAMPPKLAPTLAVLIAPPAVGSVAWVRLGGSFDDPLGRVLLAATLFHVLLLATQIDTLRKAPFALSAWAYTFPLASASVALMTASLTLPWAGYRILGAACLIVLTTIVGVLVVRTSKMALRGGFFQPA
jgi:tellurite resistance protein